MIQIKRFMCNPLQENCYVVSDDTQECVIIDCGAFYQEEKNALINYIREQHLHPVHSHSWPYRPQLWQRYSF